MKRKPTHDGRIARALLAFCTLTTSLFALPGVAEAQFGQTSPFNLELNHVFYFNGDKAFYAKALDCREWADAMQTIETLRAQGQTITVIKGKAKATSFVEHAYTNRLQGVQYVDLETIIIERISDDKYRIYTANEPKQVVCGFTEVAYLDKVWVEAGLQGKDVPNEPHVPSVLDPLRAAYWLQSYALVRTSLQQRGYTAFAVPDPVAERCQPATERVCETYPEAFCENEVGTMTCTFVYKRNGTDQVIGVDADVSDLTQYTARIKVAGLRELGVDR